MKGKIYRTEGPIEDCGQLTLKEAQDIVGGYIEVIYPQGTQVIMNEDGKMLNLGFNPLATLLTGVELCGTVIIGNVLD